MYIYYSEYIVFRVLFCGGIYNRGNLQKNTPRKTNTTIARSFGSLVARAVRVCAPVGGDVTAFGTRRSVYDVCVCV